MIHQLPARKRPASSVTVIAATLLAVTVLSPWSWMARPVQAMVQLSHVSINNGFAVSVAGRQITVAPGSVWVNDKLVTVSEPVTLTIPDCPNGQIKDEKSKIYVQGKGTPPCMPLKAHATNDDYAPLNGEVPQAAMKVKDAPGPNAHFYKNGIDYLMDMMYGVVYRTGASAIKEGQSVYLDYVYYQRRLDTIAVDEDGHVKLLPGSLARSAPEPAALPANMLALAHVVAAPGNLALKEEDVLPIACNDCRNFANNREMNQKALKKTLAKLKSGEPITIDFWGDSITAGCDASKRELGYADVFIERLRKRFPKAQITAKNCGVGGSTTTSRLPKIDKELLSNKPDLVIIEFVNDVRLQKEELDRNYGQVADKLADADCEVILINPHQPAPVLVNAKDWRALPGQFYYAFARKFAKDYNWALADVESRWEGLGKEGLAPELMLVDNLVHINNSGHSLYADTILSCLL